MDIKEYANQSRLPLKSLLWMARKHIISDPLADNDVLGLKMLEKVWGSSELVKAQIRRFSKPERTRLITTCEYETKWEAYAHTRFSNAEDNERISIKQLISEIEMSLDITIDHWQKQTLYRIRERIYNQRRYKIKTKKKEDGKV